MQRSIRAVAGRCGRLAAAAGIGAVMALGASATATASPPQQTGTIPVTKPFTVLVNKIGEKPVGVSRLTLKLKDGKQVLAYCVDLSHPVAADNVYTEATGSGVTVPDLDKVRALLDRSLPVRPAADVAGAAGLGKLLDGLSPADVENAVYAATQAAVWNLVEPTAFELALPDAAEKAKGELGKVDAKLDLEKWLKTYKVIAQVYKFLLGSAKPALSIDPDKASAAVGQTAGPFAVKSQGVGQPSLSVAEGAVLVDEKGNAITKPGKDGTFRVRCEKVGQFKVEAKAAYKTAKVKVYTGVGKRGYGGRDAVEARGGRTEVKSQTVVTVEVVDDHLTASATVNCTGDKTESGGLPVTGAPVRATIAAGLVLLAAGAGLFLVHRRRVRFTA